HGIPAFHVTGVQTCALPIYAEGGAATDDELASIDHLRLHAASSALLRHEPWRGDDEVDGEGDAVVRVPPLVGVIALEVDEGQLEIGRASCRESERARESAEP